MAKGVGISPREDEPELWCEVVQVLVEADVRHGRDMRFGCCSQNLDFRVRVSQLDTTDTRELFTDLCWLLDPRDKFLALCKWDKGDGR